MTKLFRYNVIFRPEPEGGFTVLVPSLPGCVTWGKNLEEAKKMAQEAIALYLESLREDGEPIPQDAGIFTGAVEIPLAVKNRRKLAHV